MDIFTGIITEVDESKAYSWEVCDKCGSDKLSYRGNTKLVIYKI